MCMCIYIYRYTVASPAHIHRTPGAGNSGGRHRIFDLAFWGECAKVNQKLWLGDDSSISEQEECSLKLKDFGSVYTTSMFSKFADKGRQTLVFSSFTMLKSKWISEAAVCNSDWSCGTILESQTHQQFLMVSLVVSRCFNHQKWMSYLKNMVFPMFSPIFIGVSRSFHEINHPFLGYPHDYGNHIPLVVVVFWGADSATPRRGHSSDRLASPLSPPMLSPRSSPEPSGRWPWLPWTSGEHHG